MGIEQDFRVKNGLVVGQTITTSGISVSGNATFNSTGAVKLPAGTEAQRPTGAAGQLRFNSTTTQFEGYNGAEWGAIGGASEWISVANTYTTSSGEAIIADTTAGSFTITLPATPVEGDYIVIVDGSDWSTANLTVARNGSTIDGLAEDLIVDIGSVKIEFLYDGTTWKVYTNIGQVGIDETISLLGRTITGTADQIAVTNGNGASGNPVISAVVASTAEAIAGTNNTKLMTPLRAAQARIDPENRIINGAFDFWQRGTDYSSGTYIGYTADRWYLDRSGGNASVVMDTEPLGTVLGSTSPKTVMRFGVANQTLASHTAYIQQPIEGVRSYAGQTITVLGWARRFSGSGNVSINLYQIFGTGGSPSGAVGAGGQQVSLTSSWQPFAVTFTMPSISGKTLGTNNNDSLLLRFFSSAGSNFNGESGSLGLQTIAINLFGIHIKVGTHTTDAVNLYKQPELGPELARCQRYYEKSYQLSVNPGTAIATSCVTYQTTGSATLTFNSTPLVVRKRAAPSIQFWDLAGNVSRLSSGTNNFAIAAGSLSASEYNLTLDAGISGVAANSKVQFHFAVDAEL